MSPPSSRQRTPQEVAQYIAAELDRAFEQMPRDDQTVAGFIAGLEPFDALVLPPNVDVHIEGDTLHYTIRMPATFQFVHTLEI